MKYAIILFLLSTLTVAKDAMALEVELLIRGVSDPVAAVGLILTKAGTEQREVTSLQKLGQSSAIVTFRYTDRDVRAGNLATAIVTGSSGQKAFATVTELRSGVTNQALLHLRACQPGSQPELSVKPDQLTLLEQLVALRKERREVKQRTVTQIMSEGLLKKLNRLEAGFGFRYETPLSADLNPVVLSQRLDQLLHTVEAYELHKEAAGRQ